MQYQGFDGGNPLSKLWFCGIEYGGTSDLSEVQFVDDVPGDWVEWQEDKGFRIPYLTPRDMNKILNDDIRIDGPFALAQSKITTHYYDQAVDTWKKLAGKDGYCFKMNLYPLAFQAHNDALWEKAHYEKTGFVSKSEYKSWNLNNRFPRLKQLVNSYQPKVLICLGQSLATEFLTAFCDNDDQIF